MNLIQGLLKIRLGLEKDDMQLVADGYEMLSGEKVEVNTDLKIEIVSPKLDFDELKEKIATEVYIETKKAIKEHDGKIPGKRGRPKKPKFVLQEQTIENVRRVVEPNLMGKEKKPNKFVDDGTLFIEDREIDAKLQKGKPPVERRPPVQMLNIKCEGCSKQYEVNPAYFDPDMRKLCNRCAKRG